MDYTSNIIFENSPLHSRSESRLSFELLCKSSLSIHQHELFYLDNVR